MRLPTKVTRWPIRNWPRSATWGPTTGPPLMTNQLVAMKIPRPATIPVTTPLASALLSFVAIRQAPRLAGIPDMDPISALPSLVERADHPVDQRVHPFRHVDGSHSRDAWTGCHAVLLSRVTPAVPFRNTSPASTPAPHRRRSGCRALDQVGCPASRSVCPSICSKRLPRQVAFAQLQ